MAFATITFPTTLFSFFLGIGKIKIEIAKEIVGSIVYGYFLNGEVFSIHRSPFLHFIGNLYSYHSLALPMNFPVMGLS